MGQAYDGSIHKRLKLHKALAMQYVKVYECSQKAASTKAFNKVKYMTEATLDEFIKILCK